MDYKENRKKIKTGDLIAFSGGSWTNWHDIQVNLVRMATRSEYSHVAIAWVVLERVMLLEAVGAGVRIYPLSNDLPCYWIPRSHSLNTVALEAAFSIIGQKYSKWEAIKSFFGKVKIGEDKLWECAEFVMHIYAKQGEVLDCLPTPTDVVKTCISKWDAPVNFLE